MPAHKRRTRNDDRRPRIRPDIVERLHEELVASGEEEIPPVANLGDEEDPFKIWFKRNAERELWFFSRWVLGNDHLSLGTLHRDEICPFLTNFSISRSKLLMLPMGHLKTTVASRSLPLHALIQPSKTNIYAPGILGRNLRICLANESEEKSKDNLSVSRENLENNPLIHWLWPEVMWGNKKDAPRWTDDAIEIPRTRTWAEPSVRAMGVKTSFVGMYFDIIIADDIAALEASQNPPIMERVRKWRRASRTRFHDKIMGIYIGVGTHWPSAEDVYSSWKKDKAVEVMIRSVLEPDESGAMQPLWPEKFSMEIIENIRRDADPNEWACWYMNQPASGGFTSLAWGDLREYELAVDDVLQKEVLYFAESDLDEVIKHREEQRGQNLSFRLGAGALSQGQPRKRPIDGYDKQYLQYMRWKHADMLPEGQREQKYDPFKNDKEFFGRN